MKPILMVGATGVTGSNVAQLLRRRHSELPLVLAARRTQAAQALAAELGHAEALHMDLSAAVLQLARAEFSSIVVFLKDGGLTLMDFAGANAIPYLSLSSGHFEIGPELAHGLAASRTAPIVLASHWFCGAATIAAVDLARRLDIVESIEIGVLVDSSESQSGPAAARDFERIAQTCPSSLHRRSGLYHWASPGEVDVFYRADGKRVSAYHSVSYDILSLGAATRAPDIKVLQHFGVSSSRDAGEPASDEICIRIVGRGPDGKRRELRRTLAMPRTRTSLTVLTTAALLEHLTGLRGPAPVGAGLYMPEHVLDPAVYLKNLKSAGVAIAESS